jgi:stearoyl-CoA desaturase (Delta-9 desaturase)
MKTIEPSIKPTLDLHTSESRPSAEAQNTQTAQQAAPILFTDPEHDHHADHDHEHPELAPLPLGHRIANLIVIMLPIMAVITGATYAWGWGFGWLELSLFLGMYLLTGLGITIGFHRLFTHKSFETNRPVTAFLGIAGSMAVEGPLLDWVAFHRCHHQHSDHHDDPHTPHGHGSGVKGIIKGIWRAQIGWLFEPKRADIRKYVPDLEKDRMVSTISKLFPLWVVLSFAIPATIGGLVTMSWVGAILGFVWGGLVRVVFVHHVTWSVNSICHVWGTQPFKSHDESRNNPIVGILAFGEGWHNNHHAFPTSARHGLKWWQIDVSWLLIWAASKVGLAQKVRVPTRERMESKRR